MKDAFERYKAAYDEAEYAFLNVIKQGSTSNLDDVKCFMEHWLFMHSEKYAAQNPHMGQRTETENADESTA